MPTMTQSASEANKTNSFNKPSCSLCVCLAKVHQRIASRNLHNVCLLYNLHEIIRISLGLVLANEDAAERGGWWENLKN